MIFGIAVRNVTRHRRRSALTVAAIAIAVLMMILSHGLVNGLEKSLTDEAVFGGMGAVQIHKRGFTENVSKDPLSFRFRYDEALRAKIATAVDVTHQSPRILFAAMVSAGDKSVATPIIAFDPKDEYAVCPQRLDNIGRGEMLGEAVVSPAIAERLKLDVGRELVFLGSDSEGVLNGATATVSGVLRDMPILAAQPKLAQLALPIAQQLLRLEGEVLEVAVSVRDYREPNAARAALAAALGEGFEVHTWRERNKAQNDFLAQRKQIFGLITRIFLVLALIGVANTMLMSVLSRTREIGTMLAVGVRRAVIRQMFVVEALVIAVAGSLLGGGVGIAIVAWLSAHGLPMPVPGKPLGVVLHPFAQASFVAETMFFVLLGTLIAAMLPAHRAAKLKPVEALSSL